MMLTVLFFFFIVLSCFSFDNLACHKLNPSGAHGMS